MKFIKYISFIVGCTNIIFSFKNLNIHQLCTGLLMIANGIAFDNYERQQEVIETQEKLIKMQGLIIRRKEDGHKGI